jgi:hypothetical protein
MNLKKDKEENEFLIYQNNINKKNLKEGYISRILYKFTNFSSKNILLWSFMILFTNTYLWSETLQCSTLHRPEFKMKQDYS